MVRPGYLVLFAIQMLLRAAPAYSQNVAPIYGFKDRFNAAIGVSAAAMDDGDGVQRLYGVNGTAGVNLLNKFSDFSVAFATTPALSMHPGEKNNQEQYFWFGFPFHLQFNAGHAATHNFYSSLGFFLGAGYNLGTLQGEFDAGPLLITGIRFWLLKRSFTLRYAYTSFGQSGFAQHEISLQANVGRYLSDARSNNKISRFVRPFRK